MFCFHETIRKEELSAGVVVQELGYGTGMNVLHWNIANRSIVPMHKHPQEQFGYVIKGGFEIEVGNEKANLKTGDAYFIPPNVPHSFVAIGETEAIDVFSPVKTDFPWTE